MNKKKISLKLSKWEIAIAGVIIISIAVFCCSKNELLSALAGLAIGFSLVFYIVAGLANFFRKKLLDKKKNENPFFREIDKKILEVELDRQVEFVQYLYQDGGIIDRMVAKNGLTVLVKRKNHLEAEISINDAGSTIMLPFVISYCASVYVACIFPASNEIVAPYITIAIITAISVVMLFAILYFVTYRESDKTALQEFEELKVNEKLEKFKSCIPPMEEIDDIAKAYMEGQSKLTQTEDVKKCKKACIKAKIKSFVEAIHKLYTKFKTKIRFILKVKNHMKKGEIEK